MQKKQYARPAIEIIGLRSEQFICLSIPISPGPGPGGGGQAKDGFFDEESDDDSEEPGNVGYNKMWED